MFKRYLNLFKNIKNWLSYFAVKRNPQKLFLMKGKSGTSFWVMEKILPIFKEIYMQNLYDIEFIQKKVKKDAPVIVDIGANVGYAATFFFSHFPKAHIISFEPLPTNFDLLCKNQKQNLFLKWQIVPKAIGRNNDKVLLYFQKKQGLTPIPSIYADFDSQNQDCIEVEMISLPQVFQDFGLDKIDLLKLDCEGAEYEILYHTPQEYLNKIHCIVMETHHRNNENENKEALVNFLQNIGFQVETKKEMLWAWKK